MGLLHFFLWGSQPKLSFATVGEGRSKVYLGKSKQKQHRISRGSDDLSSIKLLFLLPMILLLAAVKHRRSRNFKEKTEIAPLKTVNTSKYLPFWGVFHPSPKRFHQDFWYMFSKGSQPTWRITPTWSSAKWKGSHSTPLRGLKPSPWWFSPRIRPLWDDPPSKPSEISLLNIFLALEVTRMQIGFREKSGDFKPPLAWCWRPWKFHGDNLRYQLVASFIAGIFVHQHYEGCIEPSLWLSQALWAFWNLFEICLYWTFFLKSACIDASLWSVSLKAQAHIQSSLIHPGCGSKMIDLPKKWWISMLGEKVPPPQKKVYIYIYRYSPYKAVLIQTWKIPAWKGSLFSKELLFSYTKLTSLNLAAHCSQG